MLKQEHKILKEEQIMEQIKLWGNRGDFPPEDLQIQLVRAIMQLSAYAADLKRITEGLKPIRPLESYPKNVLYHAIDQND